MGSGGDDKGQAAPAVGSLLGKHQFIFRLLRRRDLPSAVRLVGAEIIEHYNAGKGYAWPSYAHLQKTTGLARSTVAEAVDRLVKEGVIQKAKGFPGRANRYVPVWSWGLPATSDPSSETDGGSSVGQTQVDGPAGPYTTYIPEVSNVGDGSSSPAGAGSLGVAGGGGAAGGIAADFDRFWEAYPKKVRQPAAEEEFTRAVAKGVDPRILVDKAAQYARSVEHLAEQPRWIKLPENWLRDRRWLDDPQPHVPREKADPAAKRGKAKKQKGKAAKKPARKEPMADKGRTGRPARTGAKEGDSARVSGGSAEAGEPPFKHEDHVFVEGIGYGFITGGGRKRLHVFFEAPRDGRADKSRTFNQPWPEMRKVTRAEALADWDAAGPRVDGTGDSDSEGAADVANPPFGCSDFVFVNGYGPGRIEAVGAKSLSVRMAATGLTRRVGLQTWDRLKSSDAQEYERAREEGGRPPFNRGHRVESDDRGKGTVCTKGRGWFSVKFDRGKALHQIQYADWPKFRAVVGADGSAGVADLLE